MNDTERWINLEGPEPPGIRELFDAARADRDPHPHHHAELEMTPERAARLERRVFAAVAADRRREAWQRWKKPAAVLSLLAACLAGAFAAALALRGRVLSVSILAARPLPALSALPAPLTGALGAKALAPPLLGSPTAPDPPASSAVTPARPRHPPGSPP